MIIDVKLTWDVDDNLDLLQTEQLINAMVTDMYRRNMPYVNSINMEFLKPRHH